MSVQGSLANVVIVLDEPKDLVNIGGVVRVMTNMGLARLRLVNPDAYDDRRVERIAHRSERIRSAIEHYATLAEAVADAVFVVGTSARPRAASTNATRPRSVAPDILRRTVDGPVAVLFGREDRGLTNEGLDLCHQVVVIPTSPDNSSLNLAQACLVICYELLLATGDFEPEDELGRGKEARTTPPATQEEIERMYEALEQGLSRIDFFKGNRQAESVLRTLRGMLGRVEPNEREAKLVQAIGYKIAAYLDRRGDDG